MIAEIEKRPERMRSPDTKYPFFKGIGEIAPTSIFAQVLPGHCLPVCEFSRQHRLTLTSAKELEQITSEPESILEKAYLSNVFSRNDHMEVGFVLGDELI